MVHLDLTSLHSESRAPVVTSMSFLNEIMARYPRAVSFAPGAPNLAFLDDLDVGRHVEAYLRYRCEQQGIDRRAALRTLYEYGPGRGIINDLVAESLHRDQGIDVPPGAIVITVGAQEAMFLVLRALRNCADDLLAVVQPCYVGVLGAARLVDMQVVPVAESGAGIDLDGLRAACRAARVRGQRIRALYLAADFANPSGTRLDRAARQALLDCASEEDLLLIEDSAYGFTAAPGTELPALKALDTDGRVIVVGTFAKVCLPGARVGFVIADQVLHAPHGPAGRLADLLAVMKTMVTVNTSPISQAVIGGIIREHGGSLGGPARRKGELYRRNLGWLTDALDRHLHDAGVTWNRPEGGLFVRMHLPVRVDAALLEISARDYGVLWTPMAPFYLDSTGDCDLRLSCSYLDADEIEEGVRRLAAFLHGVTSSRPCPTSAVSG